MHASFVIALVLRLREQGLQVSPADAFAAAALVRSGSKWDRQQLLSLLASVLVKRAQDFPLFEAQFARCYDQPEEQPPPPPPSPPSAEPPPPEPPTRPGFLGLHWRRPPNTSSESPWSRWLPRSPLARAIVATMAFALVMWTISLPAGGKRVLQELLDTIQSVVPRLLNIDGSKPPPDKSDSTLVDLLTSSVALGLLGATLVCFLALRAGLHWWAKRALGPDTGSRPIERAAEAQGDGTTFRVGSLGGAPLPFLSRPLAADIAEMLSYRPSEATTLDIDLRETIAGYTRGAEPAALVFQRRRELPTVLVLIDESSTARHWHSLADEFVAELARRGVAHERIAFTGSLFERRLGRLEPRPEAVMLEALVSAPGWTVTTIFAEVHRLALADTRRLRSLAENGPVLFLDYRHRWLWDRRHADLIAAGVPVVPATARHLHDGLARIFAPDRAPLAQAFVPRRRWGAVSPLAIMADILDDSALQWASACALVQPTSFALAEQLRTLHPNLAADGELSFSRLAALPGSWLGPEGLRFGAPIRRELLNHFATLPVEKRQAAVRLVEQAFENEPDDETASALWTYARAQVGLFGDNTDAALTTLGDIQQQGLVDAASLDRLMTSLRFADDDTNNSTAAIRLPAAPQRVTSRDRLGSHPAPARAGRPLEIAHWTVEVAESRISLHGPFAHASSQPVAAFLSGGQYLLIDGHPETQGIAAVDSLLGTIHSVFPIADRGGLRGLWAAADAPLAAALFNDGTLRLLTFSSTQSGSNQPIGEVLDGAGPLVAISPDGQRVAAQTGDERLRVITPVSDAPAGSREFDFPARITALVFPHASYALVGLEDGQLKRLELIATAQVQEDLVRDVFDRFDGAVTAISPVDPYDRDGDIVVGLADGQVALVQPRGSSSTGLKLAWTARQIMAVPDRPAAAILNSERSEIGLSAIVIGQEGQCDVVGFFGSSGPAAAQSSSFDHPPLSLLERDILPERDGVRTLAVSGQSRRLVVQRNRAIEIHPLAYRLDAPTPVADAAEPPPQAVPA